MLQLAAKLIFTLFILLVFFFFLLFANRILTESSKNKAAPGWEISVLQVVHSTVRVQKMHFIFLSQKFIIEQEGLEALNAH